jgi:hypothetical protein
MPARPTRLDEIGAKLRGAAARDVLLPVCCFKNEHGRACSRPPAVLLTVKSADGHGEVYVLCRQDLKTVLEHNPEVSPRELEQSMIVY